MDVAFGMRGAARVVIVDASATGADPGTLYRVPAEELTELPPIDGLHTHNFRWDHALSFSAWLLGPLRPTDVTVFLVEAGRLEPGAPLTPPVNAAMESVIALLERDFFPAPDAEPLTVDITSEGYLHLPASLAAERFAADVCVARVEGTDLVLMPLAGAGNGGLVLKQRNPAGDRSLLISEVFAFAPTVGRFTVAWDDDSGALRVLLAEGSRRADQGAIPGATQRDGRADRGSGGARAVDGLSGDVDSPGHRSATTAGLPDPDKSSAGGRRDSARSTPWQQEVSPDD